jgi:hypothetical protein
VKTNVDQPKTATEESFVVRAQRAMLKAADKAREDYRRHGIDPVEVPYPKKPLLKS